jgi:hypothetical protein
VIAEELLKPETERGPNGFPFRPRQDFPLLYQLSYIPLRWTARDRTLNTSGAASIIFIGGNPGATSGSRSAIAASDHGADSLSLLGLSVAS